MRYADILQDSLMYIDAHLNEKLDTEMLAARAGFSPCHYSHVFRFGVGYSVMEYVRLRRLAYAAADLTTGKRIIDIAMEYGFETHSGFSKAFRRHFNCAPETYRIHAQQARPPLPSLAAMEKYIPGGLIMEPKIVAKPAVKVAGYFIKTSMNAGQNNREIPAFWGAYMNDGRVNKLHGEGFVKNHAEYGACFPADPQTGEFIYAIAVEFHEGAAIPPEYTVFDIPAATYAVFSTPPSNQANFTPNIQGTWNFIYNEWFPASGYEFAEGCVDYELYDERCMTENEKVCDVCIPVVKR